MHRIPDIP